MTQPYYVSPEQIMKDRADFARKGIARGRSVVVISCRDGILLLAENPSASLNKVGEIYDRIAFAAVGKYNEFESLRQAGVRYADLRGYSYDRRDVTARGLASVYAQSLGAGFIAEQKPFEVELAVAELAPEQSGDHIFRLSFDGSIADEKNFLAMGGHAESLNARLSSEYTPDLDFAGALRMGVRALAASRAAESRAAASRAGVSTASAPSEGAPSSGASAETAPRESSAAENTAPAGADPGEGLGLEAAVLERNPARWRSGRRAFFRLDAAAITALLGSGT